MAVRVFTVAERRARLGRRHFLAGPGASVDEVTAALLGLHATDPTTPYLSLWARLPGFERDDLSTALYDDRRLVRQVAMRRTLWMVPTDRLPAVQVAASNRVADTETRKLIADVQKAGVAADGSAWLDRARRAVLRHLDDNGPTSAADLRLALPELAGTWDPAPGKPWGGQTSLAPRVLTVLDVRGDIMRGHNQGGWTSSRPLWCSATAWIGEVPNAEPDAAATDMVRNWLRNFGPATVADITWWFGHTLGWVRRALVDIGAVEVDLHGSPGVVLPDDVDIDPPPQPWVALLPGLDVTTMGWTERDWYLNDLRAQVFDTRGNAGPTAWVDGRVIGGWRQTEDARVEVQVIADVGRDARKALQHNADRLTEWLDGARIKPRFPSPLTKA
ncbi:winged helix DNA-binding domain-containing protein [Arthrobacter sp. SLBN-53]|uniref:winged helix DNA-binding domain-containing protein n=1 Tax=Arthrobacter sp. SLBN-53 TaxID=2768412 RepID=UPI001173015F|nr:winged helix DNA-binding domain-containing protein [Arthrobacter sp. SLBN-53]TQK27716.1 winged helix DNA-binding protein [Arthrobacter sp. SLBN-53]